MGRAAKLRAVRREAQPDGIQIAEIDYLRLARARDKVNAAVFAGEQAVRAAITHAERPVVAAREEFQAKLNATIAQYKMPVGDYDWDDERCLLILKKGTS
jgi:hypothetical protein